MSGGFWFTYERAGYVEVADGDGNTVRIHLCRDSRGRLGVVREGEEYTMNAGKLTADFGPDNRGFADERAAEGYIQRYVVTW